MFDLRIGTGHGSVVGSCRFGYLPRYVEKAATALSGVHQNEQGMPPSREVWWFVVIVAEGESDAEGVRIAISRRKEVQLPEGLVHGRGC